MYRKTLGGTLKIAQLNTVETSVDTWTDFIEASMTSEFYDAALKHTTDLELAASLTLLHNYLSTFGEDEQRRIESNVEEFYKYAEGFINELAPFRYSQDGYDEDIRAAFIGKIRSLLAAQKDEAGKVIHEDKYIFIRTLVKFCSSLDYIISVHDRYKQYLFRDLPQLRSRQ